MKDSGSMERVRDKVFLQIRKGIGMMVIGWMMHNMVMG